MAVPVYTAEAGGRRFTAHSVAAALASAGLPRVLDRRAAAAALTGCLPPEATLFRGVRRVGAPGRWLVGRRRPVELGPAARELRRRLTAAVRSRVEAGTVCALSGGVDSAGLAAIAAEVCRVPVWTLADDFAADGEAARVRAVARALGLVLHEVQVSEADLPARAAAAVLACGEPLWNGRAVSLLWLFEAMAAAGARRALSGTGADEVFCGQPVGYAAFPRARAAETALARQLLRPEHTLPPPRPAGMPRSAAALQRLALTRVLPVSTLGPERGLGFACGVEVCHPYLDDAVVAHAVSLPGPLLAAGNLGKRVLRQGLAGLVPDAVRLRAKVPRLAPRGGRSPRARAAWLAFYRCWLSRARLDALALVDAGRVEVLLRELTHLPPGDPGRAVRDAVLMRLASLSVLERNSTAP